MEIYQFENGLKLIYKENKGNLTSFCIALNGGASVEEDDYGLAHLVEHMVFKETANRNEMAINEELDDIFGFNNAMTNYPYVIYYGTSLCEDFEKGVELYSDILLNPVFREEGLKEEKKIILEELKEWKDDPYQYCEDELLRNAFNNIRIKELIIGNEEKIKGFSLDEVKNFYNKFYNPENAVIAVISSKSFLEVKNIIGEYFKNWNNKYHYIHKNVYERNKEGIFITKKEDITGSKINIMYNIYDLSPRELIILRLLDQLLSKGTSSLLYNYIRTENNLVYEIGTRFKYENGIRLYIIYFGTSKEKVNLAVELINKTINLLKEGKYSIDKELVQKLYKRAKLQRELNFQRCIVEAKEIATYQLMFGDYNIVYDEIQELKEIKYEEIIVVVKKVFKKATIQILSPI